MNNFNWNFPTQLVYGEGRINEIGSIAKTYGKKGYDCNL